MLPDQVCGVCGGKGQSAEICGNVVTVVVCEDSKGCNDDSDAAISNEQEAAFMCDTPGEYSDESNNEGVVVRLLGRLETSRIEWGIVPHVLLINRNDKL